jgi:mRNA interferase MazF
VSTTSLGGWGFGEPQVKLPKRSWVKISQIRTLSSERIGGRIGRLEPERLDLLVEGLNELIAD